MHFFGTKHYFSTIRRRPKRRVRIPRATPFPPTTAQEQPRNPFPRCNQSGAGVGAAREVISSSATCIIFRQRPDALKFVFAVSSNSMSPPTIAPSLSPSSRLLWGWPFFYFYHKITKINCKQIRNIRTRSSMSTVGGVVVARVEEGGEDKEEQEGRDL